MKWTLLAMLLGSGMAIPARAENPMKACGAKYRAAKADGTLPAGQTWPQFLSACRATLPKSDTTSPASAAATGAPTRVQQCAAQYHADKVAGKLPAGQRWPQYYSACSARLKG